MSNTQHMLPRTVIVIQCLKNLHVELFQRYSQPDVCYNAVRHTAVPCMLQARSTAAVNAARQAAKSKVKHQNQ